MTPCLFYKKIKGRASFHDDDDDDDDDEMTPSKSWDKIAAALKLFEECEHTLNILFSTYMFIWW